MRRRTVDCLLFPVKFYTLVEIVSTIKAGMACSHVWKQYVKFVLCYVHLFIVQKLELSNLP